MYYFMRFRSLATISVNILAALDPENMRLLHQVHANLYQQVAPKPTTMADQWSHLAARDGAYRHLTVTGY